MMRWFYDDDDDGGDGDDDDDGDDDGDDRALRQQFPAKLDFAQFSWHERKKLRDIYQLIKSWPT